MASYAQLIFILEIVNPRRKCQVLCISFSSESNAKKLQLTEQLNSVKFEISLVKLSSLD